MRRQFTKTEARLLHRAASGDHTIEGWRERHYALKLSHRRLARIRRHRVSGVTIESLYLTGEGLAAVQNGEVA